MNFNRDELYEEVWKTPMFRLSRKYGISDRGLAKICKRMNIPVPPRGYWAKLAAGQKVKPKPLPPLEPEPYPQKPLKTVSISTSPSLTIPDELKSELLQQQKLVQLPEIPASLPMPAHPAIQKDIAENKTKLPAEGAELRKHLFYQVLFELLEKEGGVVSWSEYDDYRFTHSDCSVRFAMRTTDHIHAPHKNKAGTTVSKNPGRLFLVFEILSPLVYGIKTEWHENTFKDIFTKLPEIHVSLLTIMAVLHKEKRARDEEAAKRQAGRLRQEELERQKKIVEDIRKAEEAEKKRQAELREQEHHKMLAFISIAQHWKALDTAKEFLSYLAGRVESNGDGSGKDTLLAMIARLEAAFAKEEEAFGNIQGIMDFVENAKPPQQKPQQEPQKSVENQRVSHPEYYEHSEAYSHIPPWKRYSWFRKKY